MRVNNKNIIILELTIMFILVKLNTYLFKDNVVLLLLGVIVLFFIRKKIKSVLSKKFLNTNNLDVKHINIPIDHSLNYVENKESIPKKMLIELENAKDEYLEYCLLNINKHDIEIIKKKNKLLLKYIFINNKIFELIFLNKKNKFYKYIFYKYIFIKYKVFELIFLSK